MITLAFWGGSPGAGELVIVLAVILLLFGSKKLPSIARTMGRTLEELRRAARNFSTDIMHADMDNIVNNNMKYPEHKETPDEHDKEKNDA